MKKQIKKAAACILSSALILASAVIPAFAEPSYVNGTNFDDGSLDYSLTTDRIYGDIPRIKGQQTVTLEGDDKSLAEQALALVQAPGSSDNSNLALRLTLNKKTQTDAGSGGGKTFEIASYTNNADFNKYVVDFNIYFDARCNNHLMALFDNQAKEQRLIKIVGTNDGIKFQSSADGAEYDVALNEWHSVQIVADYTRTKVSEGVRDFSKAKAYVYLDGQLISRVEGFEKWTNPANNPHMFRITFNSNDAGWDERNIYIDNYKQYVLDEGAMAEINIPDYSEDPFVYGSDVRLYADSYIGDFSGESDLYPINKVIWYDNGEEIGEATQAPFELSYTPTVSGLHNIMAEAYTDLGRRPVDTKETSFVVEPSFREDILMSENFETYQDGTTNWNDRISGSWTIRPGDEAETAIAPHSVEIDEFHGKSLSLGNGNGRAIDAYPAQTLTSGTIKVSGEYYIDSPSNSNTMLVLRSNNTDINTLRVHSAMNLLDMQNSEEVLVNLKTRRWYKFDVITTIKDGQGYYSLYIDGKRVSQNPYNGNGFTSVRNLQRVTFISQYNPNDVIYLDNLSISKISYSENTGFFDGENEIDSISQMSGNLLTAKTPVLNGTEDKQILALYDNETGALLAVTCGTFDERTGICTAQIDMSTLGENVQAYAKVFLWADMLPKTETEILQY